MEYTARVLLLDERIAADGSLVRTWAEADGDGVRVVERASGEPRSGRLPLIAVDQVMRRYDRPLEAGVVLDGEALALGPAGGHRLRRLRHHAVVDAEGRDYLVWESPDSEPLACLARTAVGALCFLALRRSG